MDQEQNQKNAASQDRPVKTPVRYDENGNPIPPKKRPVRYDENGNPIPPKKRPVRYDENGNPIPPKKRPVRYDENGNPIPPKKRPVQYDENGNPIPPKKRPVQYDENGNPIPPKKKPVQHDENGNPIPSESSRHFGEESRQQTSRFQPEAETEPSSMDEEPQNDWEDGQEGRKKRNRFGVVISVLQGILSVVFWVLLDILGMLPVNYMVVIGIMLTLLLLFTVLSQCSRSGRKVGWVFSILVTLLLCVASVYIWKAHDVMNQVTRQPTTKLSDVSIIVMADSPAQGLQDLEGKRFGIQKTIDRENTELTLQDLNVKLNSDIQTVEYESFQSQVQALYSNKVDAIVINEIYRSIIAEDFPEFDTETRILEGFTYEKEVEQKVARTDIKVDTEPFNVYLSGNDNWGTVSLDDGRADVNIIATVNPKTKQILLTSTPRDYYIELPFYEGCYDKLTHAGLYGIETSMETLENLYDIDIDYYVRINFSGFQNIVDALGGVNVYSEYDFQSVDGKEFYKGYNQLNGYEALLFVRERYAFSNGDLQRGRNQMAMIQAMAEKIFSPAVLMNYMSLMDSVSNCFITDMPKDKIADLVKMQLNDGAEWNIVSNSVLGYGSMRTTYSGGSQLLSCVDPDYDDVEDAKELIAKCMNGEIIQAPKKDYSLKINSNYTDYIDESEPEDTETDLPEESWIIDDSSISNPEDSEEYGDSENMQESGSIGENSDIIIPPEDSSSGDESSQPEEGEESGGSSGQDSQTEGSQPVNSGGT